MHIIEPLWERRFVMLAYAASRPVPGKRQSSPNALLVVISVHVALLAAVMSAKMDFPPTRDFGRTIVDLIPAPRPPEPVRPPPSSPQSQHTTRLTNTQPNVPLPPTTDQTVDPGPGTVDPGPLLGGGTAVFPEIPKPITPIRHDPRLLTPQSDLKPPYPPSKILSEEQAVLTLRLTIDDHGRVTAVDPVGHADRAFLDAARRHLIAHWRYQPATEDGRAVASSMLVTLRFQLDG
jgi:protein TonB